MYVGIMILVYNDEITLFKYDQTKQFTIIFLNDFKLE